MVYLSIFSLKLQAQLSHNIVSESCKYDSYSWCSGALYEGENTLH